MPVHVEQMQSEVEVSGVSTAAAVGGASAAVGAANAAPTNPAWVERERLRSLTELAARDVSRVSGEGFGA